MLDIVICQTLLGQAIKNIYGNNKFKNTDISLNEWYIIISLSPALSDSYLSYTFILTELIKGTVAIQFIWRLYIFLQGI